MAGEHGVTGSSAALPRGLADTKQMGKLSREQFSLAMYLIQQKVSQGTDPPQSLTPDMIPPSERSAPTAAGPVSPTQALFWAPYRPTLEFSI